MSLDPKTLRRTLFAVFAGSVVAVAVLAGTAQAASTAELYPAPAAPAAPATTSATPDWKVSPERYLASPVYGRGVLVAE